MVALSSTVKAARAGVANKLRTFFGGSMASGKAAGASSTTGTGDAIKYLCGSIEAQTRQVCENLKAACEAAGGTLEDICRVDVYVRNIEHFEIIHKVRREYFKSPVPASTMVEVSKMVKPEYLIEISAIAVIPE